MTLHVRCVSCSSRIPLPPKASGRRIRCPNCDVLLKIPDLRGSSGRHSGLQRFLNRLSERGGLPNAVAWGLSGAWFLAIVLRPMFGEDLDMDAGIFLTFVGICFCAANCSILFDEVLKARQVSLLGFLLEGIVTRTKLPCSVRQARNGMGLGLIALTGGVACFSHYLR